MSRINYAFNGRQLETLDPGFSAYVGYLYTEVGKFIFFYLQ